MSESRKGSNWTADEVDLLRDLVKAGGRTWAQIAAELGRSKQACTLKALHLRRQGDELHAPGRERPPGEGGDAGRPRNRKELARVSFRLPLEVRDAFNELRTATGEKPGALLHHALTYSLDQDGLYDVEIVGRCLDGDSPYVGVSWSVPESTLVAVMAEHNFHFRYDAAQYAVENLLAAYGYTIERTR